MTGPYDGNLMFLREWEHMEAESEKREQREEWEAEKADESYDSDIPELEEDKT
ncbi:hypothetical protein [Bavariicoccus seileri]|uniref:hypothetical protein n=1 Tax=Bavariicoccus seileri TaxID=549685 RepID=UPI0003B6EF37|nr:hypothetical protein [Bavariicoccus seileri]